jgi:hypothetical protein
MTLSYNSLELGILKEVCMHGSYGLCLQIALSTAVLFLSCDLAQGLTTAVPQTLFTRQLGPDSTLRITAQPISAAVNGALKSPAHAVPLYVVNAVVETDNMPPQTIWTHFHTGDAAELQCLDAMIANGNLVVVMYGGISVMLYRQSLASELLVMQSEPVVVQLSTSAWSLSALLPAQGKRYRVPGEVEARLGVQKSGGWIVDVVNRMGKAAGSTRFVQVDSKWAFEAKGTRNISTR